MDNIFHISKSNEPSPTYTYYTLIGKHNNIDNEGYPLTTKKDSALAFCKEINNEKQFFIKVGLYGKVYNPIGLYSEGKANKFMAKIGKNEYNFTRVNQKVFDMYLNFLKSKNIAWLNNAEREMS